MGPINELFVSDARPRACTRTSRVIYFKLIGLENSKWTTNLKSTVAVYGQLRCQQK